MRLVAAVLVGCLGCGGGGGGSGSMDMAINPSSPWAGSYACTGNEVNTCDGAHLASGSYSQNALCPMVLTVSGSTLSTKHTDGLVVPFNVVDATHATLAGTVSTPDFPNPAGPGTIHNFKITSSTLTLGATLDESDGGSFQWVHTTGMENCTFTRTFSGPPPH